MVLKPGPGDFEFFSALSPAFSEKPEYPQTQGIISIDIPGAINDNDLG
jgi:hypothetical protein